MRKLLWVRNASVSIASYQLVGGRAHSSLPKPINCTVSQNKIAVMSVLTCTHHNYVSTEDCSKAVLWLHFVYRPRSRTTSAVLACRCCSDMIMMASFGNGKERNRQQFDSLFAAAGWRLLRITPTSGVFMVVEAEPV